MKIIKIIHKTGVHARPASLLIKAAQAFESEIFLIKNGTESNCKCLNPAILSEKSSYSKAREWVERLLKCKYSHEILTLLRSFK